MLRSTDKSYLPTGPEFTSHLLQQQMEGEPQEPAPPQPAFDPVAFRAEMLGEITKTLQGVAKGLKLDIGKMIQPSGPTPVEPPPANTAPPEHQSGNEPAKKDPQLNALEIQFKQFREETAKQLKAADEDRKQADIRAEKKDRESFVVNKLAKLNFRSEAARADAIKYFAESAERDESGALISNNLPLDKYIEQEMGATGSRAYMIQPVETAGSGAGRGNGQVAGKFMDLNSINPNSSKEEFAQYAAQIAAQVPH